MAKFNIEDIETVKRTAEDLREAIETARKGLNGCEDLAKEVGAAKYTRTTNSFTEKGENSLKAVEEYIEISDKLTDYYARMDEHLN